MMIHFTTVLANHERRTNMHYHLIDYIGYIRALKHLGHNAVNANQ